MPKFLNISNNEDSDNHNNNTMNNAANEFSVRSRSAVRVFEHVYSGTSSRFTRITIFESNIINIITSRKYEIH